MRQMWNCPRCGARLVTSDANWPRLFGEQLKEIVQACSPAEFESRMNADIGLSPVAFFPQSAQLAPARYAINVASARSWAQRGRSVVSEFRIVSQPKEKSAVAQDAHSTQVIIVGQLF